MRVDDMQQLKGEMTQSEQIASLKDLLHRDRTGLAQALAECLGVLRGYAWLSIVGEWGQYARAEQTTASLRRAVGEAFAVIEEIATTALRASGDRASGAVRLTENLPSVPPQRTAQELADIQERCIAP